MISMNDQWRIIHGDMMEELTNYKGQVNLIIFDSPYNIGKDYGDGEKADRLPLAQFQSCMDEWVQAAANALAPGGTILLWMCDRHIGVPWNSLEKAGLVWKQTYKWYISNGCYCENKAGNCTRLIFCYWKKGKPRTFNAEECQVPSWRALNNDKRAAANTKNMENWFDVPQVMPGPPEYIPGLPTQLPLRLVEPLVRTFSNPGDCAGGAPAGVVAAKAGRRYVGIDRSERYCEIASWRIRNALIQKKLFPV